MSNSVIQTDDSNEHDWHQITTTYHADETTKSEVEILYDSGLIERLVYDEEGEIIDRVFLDLDHPSRSPSPEVISNGGLFSWTRMDFSMFDIPEGHAIPINFMFDNGNSASVGNNITNDTMDSLAVSFDHNGTQDWQFKVESTYEDGETTEFAFTFFDDGQFKKEHYLESGALDYVSENDFGQMYNWSSKFTRYDSEGNVDYTRVHYDHAPSVQTVFHDDGWIKSKTFTDTHENFYSWKRKAKVFDEDGTTLSSIVWSDDGRLIKNAFSDGKRWNQTIEDTADAYSWSEIVTLYDTDGNKTQRTKINDDGVVTDTFFFTDGSRKIVSDDASDAQAWSNTITEIDANGDRTLSAVLEDDGDVRANYFEDGNRNMQVFEDVSDSKSWYARVQHYDENGVLSDTVYYDSYEDLNDATGYTSPFLEVA